ncbi:hypothetical protein QS257_16430 [Terrilactibacillus sp. S3-3]|nr:hypothetical protein QS257_16430 [Terrilactibacillus sp. S3-3]
MPPKLESVALLNWSDFYLKGGELKSEWSDFYLKGANSNQNRAISTSNGAISTQKRPNFLARAPISHRERSISGPNTPFWSLNSLSNRPQPANTYTFIPLANI